MKWLALTGALLWVCASAFFGAHAHAVPSQSLETNILKAPPEETTKQFARFTFGKRPSAVGFQCSVDGSRFRDCPSPFVVRLGYGKHAIKARSVSASGEVDDTPAFYRWRIVRPKR